MQAAPAFGAIVMAFALSHRKPMRHAGRSLIWAVTGFGLATIVFGFSRWFPLSVAMLLLTGAMDNISVVVRQSLIQLLTPDEMRGRVSAINGCLFRFRTRSAISNRARWRNCLRPRFPRSVGGLGHFGSGGNRRLGVSAIACLWAVG